MLLDKVIAGCCEDEVPTIRALNETHLPPDPSHYPDWLPAGKLLARGNWNRGWPGVPFSTGADQVSRVTLLNRSF